MKTELEIGDRVIFNGRRGFITEFHVIIEDESSDQTLASIPVSDFEANTLETMLDENGYTYQVVTTDPSAD